MNLENRRILIISPQPWDHLHVSKHHYAIELAGRNNTVYFLEPPSDNRREISITPVDAHPGLFIVQYSLGFPMLLRFHARRLYDRLMRRRCRAIVSRIGGHLDIVWAFEFNLFSNLRVFGSRFVVFHPVDPLSSTRQSDVARSAHLVLSVSPNILEDVRHTGTPSFFVNHGLSEPFSRIAAREMGTAPMRDSVVRAGYSGNLTHPLLNRRTFRRLIEEFEAVEFHLWGPVSSPVPLAPAYESEVNAFVDYLRSRRNVVLRGQVPAARLAEELCAMDCLLLSYTSTLGGWDRSNSHKILEYLSTGKVIVSSRVIAYEEYRDLLRMSADFDDSGFPQLFQETIESLDRFNSVELADQRRRLALENTYSRHIDAIDRLMTDLDPR